MRLRLVAYAKRKDVYVRIHSHFGVIVLLEPIKVKGLCDQRLGQKANLLWQGNKVQQLALNFLVMLV